MTARSTGSDTGLPHPAGAGDIRIRLTDVGLRYGALLAAENVDFTVRRGEFVSLIGPSGCGKSSVLQAVGGLLAPSGLL